MDELFEFESRLSSLLSAAGCRKYGVSELHRDTRECRDGIYTDDIAHGNSIADSFFHFMIAENVAIFIFFEETFSAFVFPCDEYELINETGQFAMSDMNACKTLLAERYGKKTPDLIIPRALAELWVSS